MRGVIIKASLLAGEILFGGLENKGR